MTKKKSSKKFLIEEILDEMLKKIGQKEEFDALTIQELRKLTAEGQLKDVVKITKVISFKEGEEFENTGIRNT